MSKKIELKKGQRFERLKVLYEFGDFERGNGWVCRCDCGRMGIYTAHELTSGAVKSCGCNRLVGFTGKKTTLRRIRQTYFNLYSVCNNPDNPKYAQFGGAGIKFCDEWDDRETGLKAFEEWSYKNGASNKALLLRIDLFDCYSPKNCMWVIPESDGE